MKLESTQTYILVTLITLLIWLYAESENEVTHTAEINVQLVAPNGYLILDQSKSLPVQIVFKAASSVRDEIMRLSQQGHIQIEVNAAENGEIRTLLIREELNRLPVFIERGARVQTTQPTSKNLRVEELVTREIPVIITARKVKLVGEAESVPKTINVTLPRSLSDRAVDLKAEASLDQIENIEDLRPNVLQTGELVSLSIPSLVGENYVQLSQNDVKVNFVITKNVEERKQSRVRILLLNEPSVSYKYDIKLQDDVFPEVQFSIDEDDLKIFKEEEMYIEVKLTEEFLQQRLREFPGEPERLHTAPTNLKPNYLTWDNPDSVKFTFQLRK